MRKILFGLALSSAGLLAQPVVSSAVNAAGYMRAGLPNGGVAQGSFIAIFGTNIGPAVPPTGIAVSGYPIQTTFSGVSGRVGGRDLLVVYASPGQVGAIVPSDTPLGAQSLTLTFGGQTSAALSVQVIARSFGVFTLNQAGSGPVVGLKFISQTDQPPSTLLEAMNPGGTITLFGTGMGASNNPDNMTATSATIPGLSASDVEVLIGGKPAPVRFFGRSSCCSSIDQIVADIPADVTPGCYVPMIVRVRGITGNASTISIAAPGKKVCSDPGGYTEEQLIAAQANGGMRQGLLNANKISIEVPGQPTILSDGMGASFIRYDINGLVRSSGDSSQFANGACTIYNVDDAEGGSVDPVTFAELDAGPALAIRNSNGTKTLDKVQNSRGFYTKTITGLPAGLPPGTPLPTLPGFEFGPEYLTIGDHTFTGPGGADVGAFSATINWPAVFNWTNRASIVTVNRASNLTINWTGGDPQGTTQITGFSSSRIGDKTIGAGFVCLEATSRGTFTIPSAILSALPVTGLISGSPLGQLAVYGMSRIANFTASGLDFGYMLYLSGQAKGSLQYN